MEHRSLCGFRADAATTRHESPNDVPLCARSCVCGESGSGASEPAAARPTVEGTRPRTQSDYLRKPGAGEITNYFVRTCSCNHNGGKRSYYLRTGASSFQRSWQRKRSPKAPMLVRILRGFEQTCRKSESLAIGRCFV